MDLLEENEANNRGRNAIFEIVVGGLLARAGLPVEFRENPDVLTDYTGRSVVIQCKRPFKSGSVMKNLVGAGRQLRKDVREHNSGLAIIAMSFSRLFNAGDKLAQFSTVDEMNEKLRIDLRRASDSLRSGLDQIKRFGVSGVFLHTATPASVESPSPGMTFKQHGAMIPIAVSKTEKSLLEEFSRLVKL